MSNVNRTNTSTSVHTSTPSAPADNTGTNNNRSSEPGFAENSSDWASTRSGASNGLGRAIRQEIGAGGVVKRGERGSSVKDLQQLLNRTGAGITADGDFGRGTENAVKAFQRTHGLTADGVVGKTTLNALLNAALGSPTAPGQPDPPTRQDPPARPESPAPTTNQYPALKSALEAGSVLKRGQRSDAVRDMQKALGLSADGIFGPGTERALKAFQSSHGLGADGVAGRKTLTALLGQNTPVVPPENDVPSGPFASAPGRAAAAFSTSRSQREEQATELLKANGHWPPKDNEVIAIQIDQDPPPASASHSSRNNYLKNYTGQTGLFQYKNGQLVEVTTPARSASHPGQMTIGSQAPDVNGDGRRDIANLPSGIYEYYTKLNYRGRFNPTSDFQGYRDTNQNGTVDGNEKNRKYTITAIQIHKGNSNSPSSIGCQTMPPTDYNRFQQSVRNAASGQSRFTYLLVRRPNDTHGENPI